jgi:hypothetical protein
MAMRWERILPAVAAVVVLVLAGIGYKLFIPVHHVERGRLAGLVVSHPPAGFTAKPASSSQVTAASNPFAEVKAAAKRSPNATGSYSVEWTATGSSSNGASILVSMLPTESDAVTVLRQAAQGYLKSTSFKSESYPFAGNFNVSGLPGAGAALYKVDPTKGDQRLAVVAFRQSRFVAVEFVQQDSPAAAQAAAGTLARDERSHLQQVESGFSLVDTTYPTAASVILGVVAVLLAAGLVVVPPAMRRGRRIQDERRAASARRQVRGRGHKIARHQAARSSGSRRR